MAGKRTPDAIALYICMRVRQRLEETGITISDLTKKLGVDRTHFYRVMAGQGGELSAARLWRISRILRCRVNYFFDGLPANLRMRPTVAELESMLTLSLAQELDAHARDLIRDYKTFNQKNRRKLRRAMARLKEDQESADRKKIRTPILQDDDE